MDRTSFGPILYHCMRVMLGKDRDWWWPTNWHTSTFTWHLFLRCVLTWLHRYTRICIWCMYNTVTCMFKFFDRLWVNLLQGNALGCGAQVYGNCLICVYVRQILWLLEHQELHFWSKTTQTFSSPLSIVHNMTQGLAMWRDALRRRAIVAQNRLFSILSDVVRLVAVGGDALQSYIAVLANFGMTSHRVAGPCDDLHHIVN